MAKGELSIPGNLRDSSGDHLEIGSSIPPPRHWRMKAKRASVRGRKVKRRRSLEVKEWWELAEEAEDGGWVLREV